MLRSPSSSSSSSVEAQVTGDCGQPPRYSRTTPETTTIVVRTYGGLLKMF